MRTKSNLAFAHLEDFSSAPEDQSDRYQRELEVRVAEALEQGYQRGYEAGRSEAEAVADARINDLTYSLNSEMAMREAAWQRDTGSALIDSVQFQMNDISEMLERHVAHLLKPLVKAMLYQEALQKFNEALGGILENGIAIEIRGSSELVKGAEQQLPNGSNATFFVTAEEAAIAIKCFDTTVSADFAKWLATVEESAA